MAYPTFAKATLTSITFPRSPTFADNDAPQPRQSESRSEAGQARVVTFSVPDELYPLDWTVLPDATVVLLLAWFNHALINWSAGSFTYTDVAAVARTVRLVPRSFVTKPVAAGHEVHMILRKEPF